MEWISVKNKMPADGGRILVTIRYEGGGPDRSYAIGILFAKYTNGKFVLFDDLGWRNKYMLWVFDGTTHETMSGRKWNITHWMPLPELPENVSK